MRLAAAFATALALLIPASALQADEPVPVGPAAGRPWKLVFQEEFHGANLDTNKWTKRTTGGGFCYHGARSEVSDDHAFLDGRGNFVLKVTQDTNGLYRYHNGINTRGHFEMTYGYVETRARFSRQPGWWGAVWMYGAEVGPNPFRMGQEIDIFEDFYKPKKQFDFQHCLHFDAQLARGQEDKHKLGDLELDLIARISRGHKLTVDDWDAFHVIGVEWTPFEYVFYADGRETFRQTFREVPVSNQPLYLLISGCYRDPKLSPYAGDYRDGTWPDELVVDYVRAWQVDAGNRQPPRVSLGLEQPVETVHPGDVLNFKLSAEPGARAMKHVRLFTNGRFRGELPAGAASGKIPLADTNLMLGENILIAMAESEDGLIGQSSPLRLVRRGPQEGASRPYENRPQTVPGRILAGRYDDGGQGVGYLCFRKSEPRGQGRTNAPAFRGDELVEARDETAVNIPWSGQWLAYTINVEQAGRYRVAPVVCRPATSVTEHYREAEDVIRLDLDGAKLAEFKFSSRLTTGKRYYADWTNLPPQTVELPAGRHLVQVRFHAHALQFAGLEFQRQ